MRILLISYYFPPAGGAAVQRWLRFIPQLIKRGVEVSVLCSVGGDYPFVDKSLKIPPGVRLIRAKAPRMGTLWSAISGARDQLPHGGISASHTSIPARILIWLRLNLIIPDLRVFWNPAAYKAAYKEISSKHYDSVITTGPPHSTHLIGMKLKRKTGIKWYTDFRDPWLNIHYLKLNPPTEIARRIHAHLEAKVLSSADGNFIISEAIAAALPDARKRILPNGFDPNEYVDLKHHTYPRFRIKYVGQITAGHDLQLLTKLAGMWKHDYELSMVGTRLNESDLKSLHLSFGERLRLVPFIPHASALQEMVDSDLLLLILNDYEGNEGMLTTKLFEYLAARSPILCLGTSEGAASRIISDTNAGQCFTPNQLSEAAQWVNSLEKSQRTEGDISLYNVERQIDILLCELPGQK